MIHFANRVNAQWPLWDTSSISQVPVINPYAAPETREAQRWVMGDPVDTLVLGPWKVEYMMHYVLFKEREKQENFQEKRL